MSLNCKEWTLISGFCTGVGTSNYWQFKWGLTLNQSCDCEADVQTIQYSMYILCNCFGRGWLISTVLAKQDLRDYVCWINFCNAISINFNSIQFFDILRQYGQNILFVQALVLNVRTMLYSTALDK